MDSTSSYDLLRNFTTPVVAITAERGGKRNGMISDAATRASIVPDVPRLMHAMGPKKFYAGKFDEMKKEVTHPIGCLDCRGAS